ncbi:hypothetical protein OH77DRAFT_985045 [Trametes cingulata]|nr:hypothetical protein OH77DRAFT_985045 [Trametes cingulata]
MSAIRRWRSNPRPRTTNSSGVRPKDDILNPDILDLFREETHLDTTPAEADYSPSFKASAETVPSGDDAVATPHSEPRTASGSARLAEIHFPPEIWMHICPHVERQADLATLARVCSGLRAIAEQTLYTNISLTNVASLTGFVRNLYEGERGLDWAIRVRSLTVDIPTSVWVSDRKVAVRLMECLHVVDNVEVVTIGSLKSDMADWIMHELPPASEEPYARFRVHDRRRLLPNLRILDLPVSLLKAFSVPKTTVTCLSVRVRWLIDHIDLLEVSRLFKESLVSLRIQRVFEVPSHQESPIRVCAFLDLPRLQYLEITDTALYMKYIWKRLPARGPFAPNRVDRQQGMPMHLMALERVPSLKELVWKPVVGEAFTRFSGEYEDRFEGFLTWLKGAVTDFEGLPIGTLVVRVEQDAFSFSRRHGGFCDCNGTRGSWTPRMESRWQSFVEDSEMEEDLA